MKRLKWNGFGHSGRNPNTVTPGELAVYCPDMPATRREYSGQLARSARSMVIPPYVCGRWELQGNGYTAVCLWPMGTSRQTMFANQSPKVTIGFQKAVEWDPPYEKYEDFLRSAIEKPTVSALPDSPQAELTVAELFLAGTM